MSFLFALMALFAVTTTSTPIVGTPVPDFSAATTADIDINLGQFAGQKVVLEWTNDGCPYVQKHYGSKNMQRLQKRLTSEGVVWITIISSAPGEQGYVTPAQANDLTSSRGAAPTHVVLDPSGEIGRLYGAKTTPHMFLIDEAGVLQYAGAIDSIPTAREKDITRAENYVLEAYTSLKAGKSVVTKQSQPYGCSVKYAAQ